MPVEYYLATKIQMIGACD